MPRPDVLESLAEVTAALPVGEPRAGQAQMAQAIDDAIRRKRHLVVQAGTGTGKSLAYLVPAITSSQRVVVATATKALQDQLVDKDLPFLAEHLDHPFTFTALKGRSNYLCLQRAEESEHDQEQLAIEGPGTGSAVQAEIAKLVEWGATTADGDRAGLPFEPSAPAWSAVSVSARECPGAARCAVGERCFAERARAKAMAADVVVVNMHLYGVHLASGGAVLPEHDVVVFDEAHQLEDVISDTAGFELTPGTFVNLSRAVGALIADQRLVADLEASGTQLGEALEPLRGERLRRPDEVLSAAIEVGQGRVQKALAAVRNVSAEGGDVGARKQRAMKVSTTVADELAALIAIRDTDVAWVEGKPHYPRLCVAPIDVREALDPLWSLGTVVLTSATVPAGLGERLGAPTGTFDVLDVGSPFDYQSNALLYCATHLPEFRSDRYADALVDELVTLIEAAGGRTLALFTSWRAMEHAVEAVRKRVKVPVMAQGELTKARLVASFAADEPSCLFATMGYWQGVDLPGRTLSLVTIDRLPFPRPDEPLLQARRELARGAAFATVDLPRATTMLAQGAGRLIRTATDRGVVAVLDPRLATARYRWDAINALPPMRRTKDRAEVEAYLRELVAEA